MYHEVATVRKKNHHILLLVIPHHLCISEGVRRDPLQLIDFLQKHPSGNTIRDEFPLPYMNAQFWLDGEAKYTIIICPKSWKESMYPRSFHIWCPPRARDRILAAAPFSSVPPAFPSP